MLRNIIICIFIFIIGIVVGGSLCWLKSYHQKDSYYNYSDEIQKIIKFEKSIISKENFSCEDYMPKDVGSLVAIIFGWNMVNNINMVSFGCHQKICHLAISNCKPWQDQECGQTFLVYEVNEHNLIKEKTFKCIQVP